MPLPIVAAGVLGPLLAQVLRYVFMAHLAGFVIRLFGTLGLSFFTNEYIVEPALQMIQGNAGGIPASLAVWLDFFGIDNVISIMASAYSLLGIKHVFLGKSS